MINRINFQKRKTKKKFAVTLCMALFSTALSFSGASAKISSKSINNVSKHYKKGKKYFSPTLGQVALDFGLIHNLRFTGVEKPGPIKDGKRLYAKDTSTDPLIQLAIELFPSPAGSLSPTVDIKENFGKNATVETVASLLKFANDLRTQKENFECTKPQPFPKGPQYTKEELNAKNTEITRHQKKYNQDIDKIKNEFSKNILSQNKGMNKAALNSVLGNIIKSMDQETSGHSFYTKHTIEQVIMAFFIERFDDADIWRLVNVLDDEIVDHPVDSNGKRIELKEDLLNVERLNEIAQKDVHESYDIDEIFALENAPFFFSLTPYNPGKDVISNSSGVKPFNQRTRKAEEGGFSDCEETTLRHILNFLFYNAEKKIFDLSALDPLNLPIKPQLDVFYAKQAPEQANEGSPELRNLFNTIVGDLNHLNTNFKSPDIEYSQKIGASGVEYELKASIVNSVHVLQKLFEVELPEMPTDSIENMKEWVGTSLQTIFKKINKERDYVVDVSNLIPAELNKNVLTGLLTIKVSEGTSPLFSFDFKSTYNGHSQIEKLENATLKDVDLNTYLSAIKNHKTDFMDQDTEQSLWAIGGPDFQEKITHPLYKLFPQKFSDNMRRIDFLKAVNGQFDDLKKDILSPENKDNMKHFKTMVKNVLEEMSWEDPAILEEISPVVLALGKKNELKGVLSETVKALNLGSESKLSKVEFKCSLEKLKELDCSCSGIEELTGLSYLSNLESLNLGSTKNLSKVAFEAPLEKLKEVNLSCSVIKELTGLCNLSNVEKLYLGHTIYLGAVEFKCSLEKLKELDFSGSGIEELTGLSYLSNLESLNLGYTKNLSQLAFESPLEKLKELNLKFSAIKELTGLSHLSNLESLNLESTKLSTVAFEDPFETLKHLNLKSVDIKELAGLSYLSNLESLNLEHTKNLSQLAFENPLEKLKELNLKFSAIKEVTGLRYLSNVEKLDLEFTKNLSKVAFDAPLEKLKTLSLSQSGIKELIGLGHLSNLKILDLSKTKITSLKFEKDNKDLVLKLKGSGIKSRADIEGFEHLAPNNVHF